MMLSYNQIISHTRNMVSAAVDQSSDYNTYTNLLFLGATCPNTILHPNDMTFSVAQKHHVALHDDTIIHTSHTSSRFFSPFLISHWRLVMYFGEFLTINSKVKEE